MKWIKYISLALLFLSLILLMMLGWVGTTQSGLNFAINAIIHWLPGLEVATISGSWNNISLEGVHYQSSHINVGINKINISVQINYYLKYFHLCINNILVDGMNIKINSKGIPYNKEFIKFKQLTKLRVPYFIILLDQFILKNISIHFDNIQVLLTELKMAFDWRSNVLTIRSSMIHGLVVNLPKITAEANKPIEKIAIKIINLMTYKSSTKTIKNLFTNYLVAKLAKIILLVDNVNIDKYQGINWNMAAGDTSIFIKNLILIASIQNKQIVIKQLDIIYPKGKITFIGSINLVRQCPVNITMQVKTYFNDLKDQLIDLKLEGGLLQQLNLMLNLTGPIKANLVAKVVLAKEELPIQLTLNSQKFNWPLQWKPEFYFENLCLYLNSKVMNYYLSLNAKINRYDMLTSLFIFDAKGNKNQFQLTNMQLKTLREKTELTDIFDCDKVIRWSGLLTLSDINIAKQWSQLPVKLNGKIVMTGSICPGNWELEIPKISLDGNIKNSLLRIRGQISGNAEGKWSFSDLNILFGHNKLIINGILSDKWKLDGIIDVQNLDGVLSDLKGSIKGQLKLRGDFKSPKFIINTIIQKFNWQTKLAIDKAKVQCDIGFNKQIYGQLIVVIHRLKQTAGLVIDNFNLNIKGHEQQHSIKINFNGKPISSHLALIGCFNQKKLLWKGLLNSASFNTSFGKWQLNQPVVIKYANKQQEVTLSEHCWLNTNGCLCLPNTTKIGRSGKINILLQQFNLALLKPFLSTEVQFIGNFNGDVKVFWYEKKGIYSLQTTVNLLGNGIKIKQLIKGFLLSVKFQTLGLNININNSKAILQWLAQNENHGKFYGNIHINNLQQDQKFSGRINIKNISLALVNPVISKDKRLSGILSADLKLSSDMQQLLLNGSLSVSDIIAKGRWFPFNIDYGFIKLNFSGFYSQLIGCINTPEGCLKLIGEASWYNIKSWQVKISITGNKLLITLPSLITRIIVKPDITFEATPNLLNFHGEMQIPWGRVVIEDLPKSSVAVSPDEVLLDANLEPIKKSGILIPILTNLQIKIGNNVYLDAFGLKARLSGILKIIQDRERLDLNGRINFLEGKFRAYGQDFIVRRGEVLFSGPINLPFLNVEAIHNTNGVSNNIITGIRIIGLVDRPQVTIFSESLKSQHEVLSHLFRGKELDSSGTNGARMAAPLINLGISKSGKILGNIGEIFGISDLTLYTYGTGNKPQFVVSGKITDNLQVKYGIGIFNSLSTLTLRYRLMPRLYLEAISGVDRVLDLLYQFEF